MPSTTTGVYRSEKYLVVERHNHRFPQRCIWCNAAVDDGGKPAAGSGVVKPPVCGTCTAIRNRLPKFVVLLGATALIASAAVYFTASVIVAAVLFFGGLVDLFAAYRLHVAAHRLRAAHEDEQYVWIVGAHHEFLAALPQWHGMKYNELRVREA
ncbi:MAG: hypothetical protein AB7E73_07980 [Burkholderiales bacterium]